MYICRLSLWTYCLYKACSHVVTNSTRNWEVDGIKSLLNGFLREVGGVGGDTLQLIENSWDINFRFSGQADENSESSDDWDLS